MFKSKQNRCSFQMAFPSGIPCLKYREANKMDVKIVVPSMTDCLVISIVDSACIIFNTLLTDRNSTGIHHD
jgi:hypothetical protein